MASDACVLIQLRRAQRRAAVMDREQAALASTRMAVEFVVDKKAKKRY